MFALFFVLILFSSVKCFAYMEGVHFYVTYTLGYWCGLDNYSFDNRESEAYVIAWANGMTDDVSETSPGVRMDEWLDSTKPEVRRRFHFPVNHFGQRVVRGSSAAFTNVDRTLIKGFGRYDKHIDIFALGIGLHTLQDSWSHDGYGPEIGHAWTTEPDYPHNDPNKSLEMAEATWSVLERWMQAVHGKSCRIKFKEIESLIRLWSEVYYENAEDLTEAWKKNTESVVQKPIHKNKYMNDKEWIRKFLNSARYLSS